MCVNLLGKSISVRSAGSWSLVIVLVAIAIGLRVYVSPWQPVATDSYTYLRYSQVLSEGGSEIEHWARGPFYSYRPLYPLMISGLSTLLDRETAGTLISVLSGGLVILPIFYLSRRLSGPVLPWGVSLLIVVIPTLVHYSGKILTESLFTFLFMTAIAFTLWLLSRRVSFPAWISAGILFGLCALTRDVGLILIPVALLWIAATQILRDRERLRSVGLSCAFFLLGFLLTLSLPELWIRSSSDIHLQKDTPFYSNVISLLLTPDLHDPTSYERYWSALTPDGLEYYAEDRIRALAVRPVGSLLWEYKDQLVEMFFTGLSRYGQTFMDVFPGFWLFLAAIGFVGAFFSATTRLLQVFLVSWAGAYLFFYIISGSGSFAAGKAELWRYLVPLVPLFLIWIGHGIWLLVSGLVVFLQRIQIAFLAFSQLIQWGGSLLLVMLLLSGLYPDWARWFASPPPRSEMFYQIVQIVGRRIALQHPPPLRVMARRVAFAYYAGADSVLIPYETPDRVIRFAHSRKVDYIVVTQNDERPHLKEWLSTQGGHPMGLRLEFGIMDRSHPGSMLLAVYRVLP